MTSPLFEPGFYERAAQRYLAQLAAAGPGERPMKLITFVSPNPTR